LTGDGARPTFIMARSSDSDSDPVSRSTHMPTATKAPAPPVRAALLVRLEAKPGKEAAVASFLQRGLAIVQREPATITWYAIKLGPSTFGIFDTFPDDAGRQAHLAGQVAAALMEKAPDLLSSPPSIEKVEILAAKMPA
jgi:quinol monooxygenase YgiN